MQLSILRRPRAVLAVLVVVALAAALLVLGAAKPSHAVNGKVLIIDTSFASGASFNEATAAQSLGLDNDVVTAAQWAAMTTADFAQYNAIVLGDDFCNGTSSTTLAAPLANLATWVPAVTGNVFFTTSDDIDHANDGDNNSGAMEQTTKGIGFAAAQGTTGLYMSSSCYEDSAWLDVLNALSPGWTATDNSADQIHVTGSATQLAGITDDTLSNYHSSVHNLVDSWASDFTVFAIATGGGGELATDGQGGPRAAATITGPYTAPDGTTGAPVILIRGADISASHILLQPPVQQHHVTEPAQLQATVSDPSPAPTATAVDGITVTFTATAGPNAGKTMQAVTDANGVATISYTSATVGTDTWEASFVDSAQATETSNTVQVGWTGLPVIPPTPSPLVIQPRFTG